MMVSIVYSDKARFDLTRGGQHRGDLLVPIG